ncbi:MAG: D-isomer specific 2-hydroxyacid dehydrogenase family protein [Oscillospiraceae bacterium]
MKMFVYNYREYDEKEYFEEYVKEFNVEISFSTLSPSLETAVLCKGCRFVSVIVTQIDRPLLEKFKELGVEGIATRSIGYDHIDLAAAKALGIQISVSSYPPNGVADFAVMLMLMLLRKAKPILLKSVSNNFGLRGSQGRELHSLTVGIVGTGRIGRQVIKNLSGFGCKILAYDPVQNPEAEEFAQYTTLQKLFETSDIISLHTPLTQGNYHMVNAASLAAMKPGVILVNTARGGLVDTGALIDALESGRVGAAGLDVLEGEQVKVFTDGGSTNFSGRQNAVLQGFSNVMVTPHAAFYTDSASRYTVKSVVESCLHLYRGTPNPLRIV